MKLMVALVAGQLVPSTIRLCVQTRAAGTLVILAIMSHQVPA